jgi:hypothetical protein
MNQKLNSPRSGGISLDNYHIWRANNEDKIARLFLIERSIDYSKYCMENFIKLKGADL